MVKKSISQEASIRPWEDRPGHFGDIWMYWTDDGLGYFEFLKLVEDIGALPIWVFNNGICHTDQVDTSAVSPFVQVCVRVCRLYLRDHWSENHLLI